MRMTKYKIAAATAVTVVALTRVTTTAFSFEKLSSLAIQRGFLKPTKSNENGSSLNNNKSIIKTSYYQNLLSREKKLLSESNNDGDSTYNKNFSWEIIERITAANGGRGEKTERLRQQPKPPVTKPKRFFLSSRLIGQDVEEKEKSPSFLFRSIHSSSKSNGFKKFVKDLNSVVANKLVEPLFSNEIEVGVSDEIIMGAALSAIALLAIISDDFNIIDNFASYGTAALAGAYISITPGPLGILARVFGEISWDCTMFARKAYKDYHVNQKVVDITKTLIGDVERLFAYGTDSTSDIGHRHSLSFHPIEDILQTFSDSIRNITQEVIHKYEKNKVAQEQENISRTHILQGIWDSSQNLSRKIIHNDDKQNLQNAAKDFIGNVTKYIIGELREATQENIRIFEESKISEKLENVGKRFVGKTTRFISEVDNNLKNTKLSDDIDTSKDGRVSLTSSLSEIQSELLSVEKVLSEVKKCRNKETQKEAKPSISKTEEKMKLIEEVGSQIKVKEEAKAVSLKEEAQFADTEERLIVASDKEIRIETEEEVSVITTEAADEVSCSEFEKEARLARVIPQEAKIPAGEEAKAVLKANEEVKLVGGAGEDNRIKAEEVSATEIEGETQFEAEVESSLGLIPYAIAEEETRTETAEKIERDTVPFKIKDEARFAEALAEEEACQKEKAEALLKAEVESQLKAEEEAMQAVAAVAEEEARQKVEKESSLKAEGESQLKGEEEAMQAVAEADKDSRLKVEKDASLMAEVESLFEAEEETVLAAAAAEEEAHREVEKEALLKAENESQIKAEEEAIQAIAALAEEEDRQKVEKEASLKAELESQLKAEEESMLAATAAEDEAREKVDKEALLKAEVESQLKAEEEDTQAAAAEVESQLKAQGTERRKIAVTREKAFLSSLYKHKNIASGITISKDDSISAEEAVGKLMVTENTSESRRKALIETYQLFHQDQIEMKLLLLCQLQTQSSRHFRP